MTSPDPLDILGDESTYPPEPDRWCDLVMKGGVTSAIVYPLAICELARGFRFKNIGGTSAGAIAAAGAAAAELRRRRDRSGAGFAKASTLPGWVGEGEHLLALFQPQSETAPLFDIFAAASDQRNGGFMAAGTAAVQGFKRWLLLGALPGLITTLIGGVGVVNSLSDAFGAGDFSPFECAAWVLLTMMGLLLAIAGAAVALSVGVVRRITGAVPKNFYGLTTGFGHGSLDGVPPLTVWLGAYLNELAGFEPDGPPLAFGDLWGLSRTLRQDNTEEWNRKAQQFRVDKSARQVNLEMMTTCLTLGRPYRFPHLPHTFYFKPSEFRRLFPESVVTWMEEHPAVPPESGAAEIAAKGGYVPFPDAVDMPVIVATRMSLSTPPLVSAVPAAAIDFSMKDPQIERCWFSDGGITSNFPVHFFDAPLPRWPTLSINLRPFPSDREPSADECDNVYMPKHNEGGVLESWNRFEKPVQGHPPKRSLPGFFGAVLHTLQNWTDSLQILQPGYRDRVAHVFQSSYEGGSNLRMDATTITRLSERGRCAGEKLRRRFETNAGDGTELTWNNHRWLRYRQIMASLETFLKAFEHGYADTQPNDLPYADLLADGGPPTGYKISGGRLEFAVLTTNSLRNLIEVWQSEEQSFRSGAPRPESLLRPTPPQDFPPGDISPDSIDPEPN